AGTTAAPDAIAKLVLLIRAGFGTDLTYYKPSTIERRIERRMALPKLEHPDDYINFIQASPDELRTLYKDILIGVTSFFRDRSPFEVLRSKVVPKLVAEKKHGAGIRIWVPACSSGEEAYSVAICLLEALGERAADYRVQIFGTDVDDDAIAD